MKPIQTLAKKIGLPTAYFVKDYRLAARNYSMSQLVQIFEFIKNADARSKGMSNRSTPQPAILKELIYKIINVA